MIVKLIQVVICDDIHAISIHILLRCTYSRIFREFVISQSTITLDTEGQYIRNINSSRIVSRSRLIRQFSICTDCVLCVIETLDKRLCCEVLQKEAYMLVLSAHIIFSALKGCVNVTFYTVNLIIGTTYHFTLESVFAIFCHVFEMQSWNEKSFSGPCFPNGEVYSAWVSC